MLREISKLFQKLKTLAATPWFQVDYFDRAQTESSNRHNKKLGVSNDFAAAMSEEKERRPSVIEGTNEF